MCIRVLALIIVSLLFLPHQAEANPLNRWQISCAVDSGSISKKGRTWTFRTSDNKCPGGIFNQRAEIYTEKISPNHKGTYRFSSFISLRSNADDKFGIFQIHDGRMGCAPPLKIDVERSGHLVITGDYKIGSQPGENCVRDILQSSGRSATKIRRDGTEYKFDVVLDFNGKGGFKVYVYLNDTLQISGAYEPNPGQGYFGSKFFFFKHGNYSQYMFDYELVSRDLRVRKVRLGG